MKAIAFISYGQGGGLIGPILSFGDGVAKLQAALREIGVDCPAPIHWHESAKTAKRISRLMPGVKVIVGGTSLGANEAPRVAALCRRKVDLMFGVQPSVYGVHNLVPKNVEHALCIRNPVWLLTGGLGSYQWARDLSNKHTKMEFVASYLPHPGDNSAAIRKLIVDRVAAIL